MQSALGTWGNRGIRENGKPYTLGLRSGRGSSLLTINGR